jgi:L-rhamnose mutarotase
MSHPLIRKAFVMRIHEGCHSEYQKRHDEIWPELVNVLKQAGAQRYSIFMLPNSNMLFAYVEIQDQAAWDAVSNTDVCKRWWSYMKDIMETNPDNSPVSTELTSAFFME